MTLLMVMTVCLLVYAALGYRMGKASTASGDTFPNLNGQGVQNPTARRELQYFIGVHLLRIPEEGAFVLNLDNPHRQMLRPRARSYEPFYS
jgi:hypothetical protein